jgi:ketosteroid isomerase-like protein
VLRSLSPVFGGLWRGHAERSARKLGVDMKLGVVVTLVTAAWCSLSSSPQAQADTDVVDDTRPAEQAAVADTLRRLFRAAEQRQLDRVEALHLYGPKFSKFDEFGLGREDADQTRVAERQGLASLRSFKASIRELKVDLFGVVAVATFLLDYAAETSQGQAAATIRSTVVLAKDGPNWRIVHEHYSPLVAKR